jgi:hypothetical protein
LRIIKLTNQIKEMKKNIIIGLLTIVSLLSLAYGYFQKDRADEQEAIAIENAKIAREATIQAEKQMEMAQRQRIIAESSMLEAVRQRQIAEEELKKRK